MNPKVIWYLVRTDWRRLWVAVVVLWVMLLFAALPSVFADFGRMADQARWIGPDNGMASMEQFQRLVVSSAMSRSRGWADVVAGVATLFTPVLVLACALIGIVGGGWSLARPVRKTEWAASKLAELMLFILLPSALMVGISTLNHGFPITAALDDSVRSLVRMLPMTIMLALAGAMCGTFGRWVGWMAGFALFFTIFNLVLRQDWLGGSAFDLWGAGGHYFQRDIGIALLLSAVMLLGKHHRSSWALVLAWPLVIGVMLGAKWVDSAVGAHHPERWTSLPALEIQGDRWKIENFRNAVKGDARKALVSAAWSEPTDGGASGQTASAWWPVGKISVTRNGSVVAEQPDPTFSERMQDRRKVVENATEKLSPLPDDLLRRSLPREAGNLISLGQVPPLTGDWLPLGVIGDINGSAPVTISARLEGVNMKCSLLGELPVGGKLDLSTDTESWRVAAAFSNGVRVNAARLSRVHGERKEPLSGLAVVLVLPKSGVSIRLSGARAFYRHQILAGCCFESVTFGVGPEEFRRVNRLFGPLNDGDLKVMVYRKEVLDRMTREVRGTHVPTLARSAEQKFPRTLGEGNTREFFMNYPKGRPDPATCTEQEAGLWIYQILALETRDDGWIAREIAPYVTRHADLFMRLPVRHWVRRAVEGAVVEGLPDPAKAGFFKAMAEEPDDRKFQVMFSVAERRGWMGEVKEIVAERISGREPVSEALAAVAVKYVEPDFYPALMERVAEGATWNLFEKVRHLPGITADLDLAVARYEQGIRGYRANNIETFMIPASNGSSKALGSILALVNEAAISGKQFDAWPQLLKVVRLPVSAAVRQQWTVDLDYGGLVADDFTWSPFLRQWMPKEHVKIPKNR